MSLKSVKQAFEIPQFTFTCGRTLPVRLGYETYGTLNEAGNSSGGIELLTRLADELDLSIL